MEFKYLSISNKVTPEIFSLLDNNIIGTPGVSMVYEHLNVWEKVTKIQEPHFVNLVRKQNILGTCCFVAGRRLTIPINLTLFIFDILHLESNSEENH